VVVRHPWRWMAVQETMDCIKVQVCERQP